MDADLRKLMGKANRDGKTAHDKAQATAKATKVLEDKAKALGKAAEALAKASEDAAKKAQASYDANRAAVTSRDKYLKAEAASNRAAAKSRATTTTVTPELPASKQSTSG
jgi:hypothetical protein